MIKPQFFFNSLTEKGVNFFCGVPDSLLKDFCAYITDHTSSAQHIITANEGGAIGLATGYYMATGNYPLVYMQNSGIGNSINPLLSLADPAVYSIPMILLIGWRGEPGVKDEPQHLKQGKVTVELLKTMDFEYAILSDNQRDVLCQINTCFEYLKNTNAPFVFVVRKGIFEKYHLEKDLSNDNKLTREAAIELVLDNLGEKDVVVSTTGMISRELYEYREKMNQGHKRDFLTVGSMGHANQIALGIAMQKQDRRIICFDGDGATIMHMGSLAIIGCYASNNYVHIVFNNGAHDSVGGQPTVAYSIDLTKIASACGYKLVFKAYNKQDIDAAIHKSIGIGPVFIEIIVEMGARPDLGRPKISPLENKVAFIDYLNNIDA